MAETTEHRLTPYGRLPMHDFFLIFFLWDDLGDLHGDLGAVLEYRQLYLSTWYSYLLILTARGMAG